GYICRRTLLDRALQPDLDRLLSSDDGWSGEGKGDTGRPGGAHNRLLDHIEANLLYYSTAIISAGDPASRHAALAKLRDPSGRPLTDLVENTVLGRIGNAIALPLRSAAQLPREWQDALAAFIPVPVAPLLAPWPTSTTSPRKQVELPVSITFATRHSKCA